MLRDALSLSFWAGACLALVADGVITDIAGKDFSAAHWTPWYYCAPIYVLGVGLGISCLLTAARILKREQK